MVGKIKLGFLGMILIPVTFQLLSPKRTLPYDQELVRFNREEAILVSIEGPPNLGEVFPDLEGGVMAPMRSVLPESYGMVGQAVDVLAKGWEGMSPEEQQIFRLFFDPGQSGQIDDAFVQDVLEHYLTIQRSYQAGVRLQLEANSEYCQGKRLYYTYWSDVHVCPFFSMEINLRRQARDLLHEYVHIALNVEDRAYYHPESAEFALLQPRGERLNQLPLVGYLFGEITLSDTIKNPDSYAWFADLVSRPG